MLNEHPEPEPQGGLCYRLADGQEFKSPSSAGSAIMGDKACNGWRFWTIADAQTQKPTKARVKKSKTEPTSGGGDGQN